MTRQKRKGKRQQAQQAQAQRRQARRAAVERTDRAERALKLARAQRRRETRRAPRHLDGLGAETTRRLSRFAQLVGLNGKERRRLRRLVSATHASLPSARSYGGMALLALAAQHHWVRKPESFEAPWGTPDQKRAAFMEHLLVRWPVPSFLLGGLKPSLGTIVRLPLELSWVLRLTARLGQGASLTEPGLLPVPLTKRMRATFLSAPQGLTPVGALRYAQVVGAGGSARLFDAVMRTRLVQLQGRHPVHGESYWHGILEWMATRSALPLEEVPWLVGWLHALRTRGDDYDPRGRPLPSVMRRLAAYRERVEVLSWAPNSWVPSGLAGYRSPGGGGWEIAEICTADTLYDEGQEMHHCAWSYLDKLKSGEVALFSLRRGGARVGTVEVSRMWGQVCQAKGKANAPLPGNARGIIRAWAQQNHLTISVRGW